MLTISNGVKKPRPLPASSTAFSGVHATLNSETWKKMATMMVRRISKIRRRLLLVGLLVTAGAAIFPVMLYSTLAPENSLTAYAVASNPRALLLASIWSPVGLALATVYFVFISPHYAGKVSVRRDTQGFY